MVEVFKTMESFSCEQVIFCYDKTTNLKAIIAFHDTTLGPALGGCRMRDYPNEEEAFLDAVKLAEGMTMKSSIARLDFGGGKAVIWGGETQKTEPLLRAMGRFVQGLHGRIITGTDMGTEPEDFAIMHKETSYLTSLPKEIGGSGDSSWMTAYGVFNGMKACLEDVYGSNSFDGKNVSIQGLGKVGRNLAGMVAKLGAKIIAADPAEEHLRLAHQQFNFENVHPNDIYGVKTDIFSPNAIGGILNDVTIPKLKCKIVAGAANNQLAEPRHGKMLLDKGILYAPDFVINAGGLIQVAAEVKQENQQAVAFKVEQIYSILKNIFAVSKVKNISSHDVAEILAMERVELMGKIKRIYVSP